MAPMAVLWDSPLPKIKKVAMTLKQLSICYRATTYLLTQLLNNPVTVFSHSLLPMASNLLFIAYSLLFIAYCPLPIAFIINNPITL
jgi:hypothetical protein